jgi:nucleoside-diphosphate-sugar epimerase
MSTNVLVLGATGFVGLGVAAALRRAGYRVYGLVRSPAKVRRRCFMFPNLVQPGLCRLCLLFSVR